MQSFVALYGGSFNLPTSAHLAVGVAVRDQVKPDQVWYLVAAQNPHKSTKDMASFAHRLEMTRLNIANEPKLVASDKEQSIRSVIDSTQSADILREIVRGEPNTRFAWVMGADCFADIHTWQRYDYILSAFPLVIVPRKGWTEQALVSVAANSPLTHRLESPDRLKSENGWYLLNFQEDEVCATNARQMVKQGQCPTSVRPEVYRYICERKLFL